MIDSILRPKFVSMYVSFFGFSSFNSVFLADWDSPKQVVSEGEYTREEVFLDGRLQRDSVWSGGCVFLHDVLVLNGS